jgi:hypothetical protein
VLIKWACIIVVQALLLVPCLVSAAGPAEPLQSNQPDRQKGDEAPASSKELADEGGHPAEHVLKELPAKSKYTVIPLPAFSYNRNEGYWVGGLAPILKPRANDEIESIIVPLYIYNPKVGHGGSLNYFGYPSDTVQYHVVGWYSERLDQGIDVGYKSLSAGGGRYIFGADFLAFKNPFSRFFGFGSKALEAQETNYTSRELVAKLTAGINLTPDLMIMVSERFRMVRVDPGVIDSLASTLQNFPDIPGIQGSQVLGHGLIVRYDTRDSQLTPTKGTYVNVLGEFNQNLQSHEENQWARVSFDARHLVPHASDRMTLVARVMFSSVFGQIERKGTMLGVPFYERPTLGGQDTLRAFGLGRYVGNWAALINLEERVTIFDEKIFDHDARLELAPFIDIGRVGRTSLDLERSILTNIQVNPGIGVRLLARPNVVGRLDLAYGKDGSNVFVGLDYPF